MYRSHHRFVAVNAIMACTLLVGVAPHAFAAIESRNILKTFFETGDVPTQDQFGDIIDSYIHQEDDNILIGTLTNSTGFARLLGVGDTIGSGMPFGRALGLGSDWSGQSGFIGLSFEENSEVHFGYVHLLTDTSSPTMYPVTIDRFVFENTPGASITVTAVPEPSTLALGLLGVTVFGLTACRRLKRLC